MSTEPKIIFRSATNNDTAQIKDIVYGVLREYGLEPEPAGTDSDLENIEQNYTGRGGVFEVLESGDGRILGTVGLYPMDPPEAATMELRKMYFLPELRGRGQGKITLARMIDRARMLGYKQVVLETHSALKEAIGLYQSFGFQPSCAGRHSARCDQTFVLEL